jgi:uncharacterized repeat protein (TIGR01451 family)
MKKIILFFSLFLCIQTTNVFSQNIDLPLKQYLCDTGSVDLDGTVLNTADTGINYQWYYSTSSNVQVIPGNEIAGATNPMYSVTTASMGVGYYKVVATMTNTSTVIDEVRVFGLSEVPTSEGVQCIDHYTINDLFETYYLFQDTSNVTYTYHYTMSEANTGLNAIADWDPINHMWVLYLRVEENSGMCVDVITIYINSWTYIPWATGVSDMGSCSPNSTNNVFDLTTNDTQIIGGQSQTGISYHITYNGAWDLQNSIPNPANYLALSPNQTIYARVYDINNPNTFCDVTDSITDFQLLSAPTPTPNSVIDYVVCDDTSGANNDGIGLFDLPSRNPLILSGLSASQFTLSYHTNLTDAQNDVNPIANPTAFVSSNTLVYSRVESNLLTDCVEISTVDLQVQNTCNDISVNLLSYWGAPTVGFDYYNKLIIKNNGPVTVSSGTVEFVMDPFLIYNTSTGVTAGNTLTPTGTGVTLDFVNLAAGSQEEILIDMTVDVVANLGDIVSNSATYTTPANDIYAGNNTSFLSEVIIGSYDPNDITESHGPEIEHATFTSDDYLYYTVRFQNVGTSNAVNITIDNTLDSKLDKTTFEMLSSSHTNTSERVYDKLTWQFDNINLADATNDEPNSHGYVYYKIKPLAGYSVGDIVPNTAGIIFDFNAPVITNTFDTEFVAALMVQDQYLDAQFMMMPNPASNQVNLVFDTVESSIEVAVYDMLGKLVLTHKTEHVSSVPVNISSLDNGIYFVKIKDSNGQLGLKKLIKE